MSSTPYPEELPAESTLALPAISIPRVPTTALLWARTLMIAGVILGVYLIDRLALLLMDYWMLESLGFASVFWTNFWMGAALFGAAFLGFGIAVAAPAFSHRLSTVARRRAVQAGALAGILAGALFAGQYLTYLPVGKSFGATDPVFGHDIGFYVFDLPAIEMSLLIAIGMAAALLVSSVVCAYLGWDGRVPHGMRRLTAFVGAASSPTTTAALLLLGLLAAVRVWFGRYAVLTRDNFDSSIASGADYLDVTGFFSTVNGFTVSALAIFFGVAALALRLRALHRSVRIPGSKTDWRKFGAVTLLMTLVPGFAIDSAFRGMVALRNETQVTPNEPVLQLPYIKRHIDATRTAFGLSDVETVEFTPNGPDDPKPEVAELLEHPTLQNAPLWPGYVSWLERQVDPEYVARILSTGGDTVIYGPTLDIYQAQQKLRPYYEFMDVDTVRYEVDGEKRMFASSVRELPLVEPQPWLAWWGQQFLLFTHGQGLVLTDVSDVNSEGEPIYASKNIPAETESTAVAVENPDVYYGEGSGSVGYSNVEQVAEHDFPTEQGRAEVFLPEDVDAGVRVDSFLKRLVFGYKSRQFFDIVFSDLINSNTRIHYFRTPLERLEHIAPFLYVDSDPYAVADGEGITWMLNGMTTTDRYPYGAFAELGDKSDRRSPTPQPTERVNYIADSVKATVDSYTGQVNFYRFADEPVINAWAGIYPDLFKAEESMPPALREQVQYPVQLLHAQFDDLFIYYHMTDPLTFFSFEDAFDDGDEVVGAYLATGDAISFSIEPYYWIAETGETLPQSTEETQFSLSTVFTPEGALNLRAIVTAYQEGDDYGKLSVLQVPKGHFYLGPEQADSAIDQDAFISQQIGLWNRRGLEVIRGHTTPLVVDGEVIYVEPLFIRSKQNPVPQMKRVVVVFRGDAAMGNTLTEALAAAVKGTQAEGFASAGIQEPAEEEDG